MEMKRRPPRDLTRKRQISSQLGMSMRREVADMIRAEAAARRTTIVDLVEKSVMAYCKEGTNDRDG